MAEISLGRRVGRRVGRRSSPPAKGADYWASPTMPGPKSPPSSRRPSPPAKGADYWAERWERAAAALAEATERLGAAERKRLAVSERSQEATLSLMRAVDTQRQLEAQLAETRKENEELKRDVEALCAGAATPRRSTDDPHGAMTAAELHDMVIGLEERLAKQQALATHWKREAFKWAQEAESDSIADAQSSVAWAARAAAEAKRGEGAEGPEGEAGGGAGAGAATPPPVPVAWLQTELRSTMAALEASRERESEMIEQLAQQAQEQPAQPEPASQAPEEGGKGADDAKTLSRTASPLESKEGRAAVAALSKLERTLGVDASKASAAAADAAGSENVGGKLEGWGWLTARLARLSSTVDGRTRLGRTYTPRKDEPELAAAAAAAAAAEPSASAADATAVSGAGSAAGGDAAESEGGGSSSVSLSPAAGGERVQSSGLRTVQSSPVTGSKEAASTPHWADDARRLMGEAGAAERGRWLAMEAYALRTKLRQCDLRSICSQLQQAASRRPGRHEFDYDFEDLIQQ